MHHFPQKSYRHTSQTFLSSGPHALLAVRTEPHDHMHLSKQMMRSVHKQVGTGVRDVYPSQFSVCCSQQ